MNTNFYSLWFDPTGNRTRVYPTGSRTQVYPVDFFEFLSTEFAACSKQPKAEIIILKRLAQGRNNVIKVRVEHRSSDQGRRKNDAFTLTASLSHMGRGNFALAPELCCFFLVPKLELTDMPAAVPHFILKP